MQPWLGLRRLDDEGEIILGIGFGDKLPVTGQFAGSEGLVVYEHIDGEHIVVGGKGLAIVPGDVLFDVQLERLEIVGVLKALHSPRAELT